MKDINYHDGKKQAAQANEQPQKFFYIDSKHPPIDFTKMEDRIVESEFKTYDEKQAFREGWVAAILSLSVYEFHDTDPRLGK